MEDFYITTNFDASHTLQCQACGRKFAQSNAYSTHVGSCRPQKKRVASALDIAQELYRRKKARLNHDLVQTQIPQPSDLDAAAAGPSEAEVGNCMPLDYAYFLIYEFQRHVLLQMRLLSAYQKLINPNFP